MSTRPCFPETAERLAAGVAFLRGKGLKKIAIVAHSMGARMANHFLIHTGDGLPGGCVGRDWAFRRVRRARRIQGAGTGPLRQDGLSKRTFIGARERAAAIKTVRGSGQVQVAGADHFFAGMEAELVRQVKLFLDNRLR